MLLYCAFTPFEWVSSQFYKMAHFGLFLSPFPISTDSPPIQSSYNLSKAEQGKFQTLMNLVTGYCVVPTSFCNSFKMAILRSYFMKMLSQHCWPDSVVTHLRQFCCNNMKKKTLAGPEQSSNWVGEINRLNQSTGIESLSAQLKARWRAINRNWASSEFSMHFLAGAAQREREQPFWAADQLSSEQIFFIAMYRSAWQGREVWALNRAIYRNWARREFSLHFLAARSSAWAWPA